MHRPWVRYVLYCVVAVGCFGVIGCGAGSENDAAFLKEAGVGEPIKDYDKGYASRKEKRQAEIDASSKSKSKSKRQ